MPATATIKHDAAAASASPAGTKRAGDDTYVPLKIRFKAWWEGVSVETFMRRQERKARRAAAAIRIDKPVEDVYANMTEFEILMTIREGVWGKDLIVPGGADYVGGFLDPAKLKPGAMILDLSAGLGGGGRSIAVAFDALVEGLETNEAIATLGAKRAERLALDKQAPVSHFLPHNPFLRVARYDCVYGHEAFHRILDKQNLFGEVWKSLKEDGHFIFTDLIFASEDAKGTPELKSWIAAEEEPPDPWLEAEYREKLAALGFEIVSFEDETESYRKTIRDGWAAFAEGLDDAEIDRRFVDIMMHEAKIWQTRMQALKTDRIRFAHVHAHRPKAAIR